MPIYEFRCLKCNECFEILVMKQENPIDCRCPKCQSEDFERVLSTTSYSIGDSSAPSQSARSQTRNCPSGTCTTIDLPGHSK